MTEKKQFQQAFDDQEEEDNKSAASDFSVVSQPEDGEADGNGNTNNDEMGMPKSGNLVKHLNKCMADIAELNQKIKTHETSKLAADLKNISQEFHKYRDDTKKLIANQQTELETLAKSMGHFKSVNTAKCYAMALPAPNGSRQIILNNGHAYNKDLETFIRYGAALCSAFYIKRGCNDADFTGYPSDFFNRLMMYTYETEQPEEIVPDLVIDLALKKPTEWPKPLIQMLIDSLKDVGGNSVQVKMDIPGIVEETVNYSERVVHYCFANKHKPGFRFRVRIYFSAKVYKQMTAFCMAKC